MKVSFFADLKNKQITLKFKYTSQKNVKNTEGNSSKKWQSKTDKVTKFNI